MAGTLLAEPRIAQARAVGLYAALPGELPSRETFDALAAGSTPRLLPRCIGEKRLAFFRIDDWDDLVPGRYGVLEPANDREPVVLGPADVVVVPAVALSPTGERLGRGAGYYDRTFDGPDAPLLIGAGYEFQVVEQLPHEEHDRRMHAIVTETGLRWVEASGS